MIHFACARKGCEETCPPLPTPLPAGWVCVVTFRETKKSGVIDFAKDDLIRDAVLCPKHAKELNEWLFPM